MGINDFDQKLAAKMKEEGMAPKPRWHFLLKDYVIWASGTLSLLIGAGAVSIMIYLFKYNGWEVQEQTHKSLWEFFLLTLPYFWIIFLGLFIFTLYYNLKHTKRGYRYPVWVIIVSSISVSIILGSLFFLVGLGERVDNILGERVPLYDKVINRHMGFWFNPEEGRLIGLVTVKNDEHSFNIQDPRGDDWLVFAGSDDFPVALLKLNQPVDLIGHILAESQFQADIIRPAEPGRGFFSRPELRDRRFPCPGDNCPRPRVPPD
jgi:hypothetical protein